jgi:hypothetical protein
MKKQLKLESGTPLGRQGCWVWHFNASTKEEPGTAKMKGAV